MGLFPNYEQRKRALNRYIDNYVDRPCKCCWACGGFIFFLAVVSSMAGTMTLDELEDTWSILDSEATQNSLALELAKDAAVMTSPAEISKISRTGRRLGRAGWAGRPVPLPALEGTLTGFLDPEVAASGGRRLQEEDITLEDYTLLIFYKSDKAGVGNVFTPEKLRDMCELESAWLKVTQFVTFRSFDSVVALFYGSDPVPSSRSLPMDGEWECGLLDEASISATVSAMKASVDVDGPRSPYARFVHPSFKDTASSAYTRTAAAVRTEEDLAQDIADGVMDHLGRKYGWLQDGLISSSAFMGEEDNFVPKDSIRVRVVSTGTNELAIMVAPDFLLAFGSIMLVWVIMALYLRSVFLASLGMYQIIFSMPVAALIYKGLTIDFFDFLHILVVYLVLGIGADDIFVLVDAFRHVSEHMAPLVKPGRYPDEVLKDLLKRTWVRSAGAIFNTSFTTAMAFMSCSGSKAMPMRTCGWYAAISILLNWIFTITFTPAVLVIWHQRVQDTRCCIAELFSLRPLGEIGQPGTESKAAHRNCIEVALDRFYIRAMNWKVGQVRPVPWAMGLGLLAVAIQGAYFTSQLTPPRSAEVWFPDTHMMTGFSAFMADNYYQPDYKDYAIVEVVFGIKDFDISDIDIYNPGGPGGKVIFDGAFDLSTEEAQDGVLSTCDWLNNLRCEFVGCNNVGYNTLRMQSDKKTHSCFLEDFREWNGGTLPVGDAFLPALKDFRENAAAGDYNSEFLVDEVSYKEDIGIVDGELRYAVIKIRSTMSVDTPYSQGNEINDFIEEQLDEHIKTLPAPLARAKLVCIVFAFLDLSRELLNGLFQGCGIAMPISFLVVLASTRNLVVSGYAVISVASIVLCVLGFCKSAMDWDLGVGEAIAGVIVIGYSVDYVVHLAHIYCEAGHHGITKREERAAFAVRNMGSTVFAGAITTAGSGLVMFFCFFYFFIKMAILICVTIMFSFIFSLGFFMSVMWVLGPQGKFGDLPNCSGSMRMMSSGGVETGKQAEAAQTADDGEKAAPMPVAAPTTERAAAGNAAVVPVCVDDWEETEV
mmetsp:Transcript_72658/g.210362  ORF Transcript_72658/g.210362 Transcript_72658/m.210362 type:complete len:1046 (+) Transcript_72658:102-3239(+)